MENPRWADINNGVLAENTRILKVFLKDELRGKDKIYPFIVDKITDKRDSHFSIYRDIECSGLAFAELGKTGYKLELNSYTIESEYEKDNTILPTLNYWLDKVFPNEKDKDGNVTKWLTPWCYEICMDWSHHSEENRKSNKMYEDSYVSSWGISTTTDQNGQMTSEQLISTGYKDGEEKARYIDCKNSNKYNITQDIAEAFEVFCQYEYTCDVRGRFKKEYTEDGKLWTGRKVIFYNRAIKTDKPATIEYKKNLNTIQRTKDSSEIYTKLYVTPIESSTMDTGYISIADTPLNPTLDDFILNFDYLYQTKAISQYQLNCVKTYEVEIHKLNKKLMNLAPHIEDLTVQINNLESKKKVIENEISSAQTTLQDYATLRDSEIRNTPIERNESNAYTMIFYEDGDIKKGRFSIEGVDKNSIIAYSDNNYNRIVFTGSQLITCEDWITPTSTDKNYYLLVDEFGWPKYIYTSKDNTDLPPIVYFKLIYCPKNEYENICNQLEDRIEIKQIAVNDIEKILSQEETIDNEEKITGGLKGLLAYREEQQNKLLEEKNILNYRLEIVLGPALREGYWTPDTYEDPGESKIVESISRNDNSGVVLKFDSEPFEGEELNYYYASIDDQIQNNKSYYPYLIVDSETLNKWKNYDLSTLTLRLSNPYGVYTSDTAIQGNFFVIYNGIKYYFKISIKKVFELELSIVNSIPTLIAKGTPITGSTDELSDAINITSYFEGTGFYLGERLLYNNAGFVLGFINDNTPILLLNNKDILYNQYKTIEYIISKDGEHLSGTLGSIQEGSDTNTWCYPRIFIYDNNVNYKSDKLRIIPYKDIFTEETQALVKYEDYTILTRNGRPCFTLKLTDVNNLDVILNYNYRIEYRISRANEMLYLDAKNVARDNAYPKYSYELKIANTPKDIDFYELGQLVYINDYSMGVHAASGYVSEITLRLDKAQDDEVKIKNYKTKFEDLFSTITASSEAMRNNQHAYNIAAGSFNSDGTIAGSVLQNSILNNNISMNYSNTNVEIDDVNGIVLTNQQPYLNGVYGQVKLVGGGIFLSNAIDASGARIWNTGITPNGINAALITAGQLDVNKVRVFAGNNIAFQWNSEGIFAYKQNEDSVDLNTYVHYSDKGLQFFSNGYATVDLGWNGLLISTQDGSTELTGKYGLVIYDGIKKYNKDKELAYNHVVRLGRFEVSEGNYEYGLRLYKNDGNDNYEENLVTTNRGTLWLKDLLIVGGQPSINANNIETYGTYVAGIIGTNNAAENKSVRFWAGADITDFENAPFRVLQDGTLYADQAIIKGDVYANNGWFKGEIQATSGIIGGWIINKDEINNDDGTISEINYLVSADGNTKLFGDGDVRIKVGDNFVITKDGTIYAAAGQIGGLTVGDINALGGDIETNRAILNVEGLTVVKAGEAVEADFIVECQRGNIPFSSTEYINNFSSIQWESREEDSETWTILQTSAVTLNFNRNYYYNKQLNKTIYIRCKFIGTKETVISNEVILTAVTESDASAIIFSIITPGGNILNSSNSVVELVTNLVDNGQIINSDISYIWEKYDIENKVYITINDATSSTLKVKASDIISYGSYRCKATYKNNVYIAYGSVQDSTDPLQCELYSTVGTQLINDSGYGAIYARSYRKETEIDPIKTTTFVDIYPNSAVNGEYVYKLNLKTKQYSLFVNNNGSWVDASSEDNPGIIYTYTFRDKFGNPTKYKNADQYVGRVLYIDNEIVDEKIIIDVTAEEVVI